MHHWAQSTEAVSFLCLCSEAKPPSSQWPSLVSRWQMVAPTLAKCLMWLDRWTGLSDWQFMVRIPLLNSQINMQKEVWVVWFHKYISTVPPDLGGPPQESLNHTLGSRVSLLCEATGVPVPSITWLKDGTPIGKRRAMIAVTDSTWVTAAV